MYKKYYKRFLDANPTIQHYASHSHHYWPDVTREAMLEYWDDSAKLLDNKWSYFSTQKIPDTQELIAQVLNLSHPSQLVFTSNTHEFVARILSCFNPSKKVSILTTDSEFYSFDRQINRLLEANLVTVEKIPTSPFDNFEERFIDKIKKNDYDFIFFSHVFFNSGMAIKDLNSIIKNVTNPKTIIAIDGYHSFMAIPTDLSQVENRAFYMAGSYKYAQGGEGCCFLSVPKKFTEENNLRPIYTGWFAGATNTKKDNFLENYHDNGQRFAGSTMDFSPLYRLNAVLSLFKSEHISVLNIHSHIQKLQKNFRDHLLTIDHSFLCEKNILSVDYTHHGHFLTFAMPSEEHAKKLYDELLAHNIFTNYRSNRLRFGFGLYQNECIDLSAL